MMVKPVVVFGSEIWAVTEGYEKTGFMGEENMKKDI
jgi:hypothetical protein